MRWKRRQGGKRGRGEISIALAHDGLFGDSAATKTCFRDGWFYPGDTGYFNASRQLFITGRVNDLLNIGGTKLNAAAVDGIIQSTSGSATEPAFMEPGPSGFEQLSIVVVPMSAANRENTASELLKKLAARFARDVLPPSIYIAEAIPRNENGKVLRNAARQKAPVRSLAQVTPSKEHPRASSRGGQYWLSISIS